MTFDSYPVSPQLDDKVPTTFPEQQDVQIINRELWTWFQEFLTEVKRARRRASLVAYSRSGDAPTGGGGDHPTASAAAAAASAAFHSQLVSKTGGNGGSPSLSSTNNISGANVVGSVPRPRFIHPGSSGLGYEDLIEFGKVDGQNTDSSASLPCLPHATAPLPPSSSPIKNNKYGSAGGGIPTPQIMNPQSGRYNNSSKADEDEYADTPYTPFTPQKYNKVVFTSTDILQSEETSSRGGGGNGASRSTVINASPRRQPQPYDPLSHSHRGGGGVGGEMPSYSDVISSRVAHRHESKLASSIRAMKRSDLEGHMEKAVRLIFQLIKERSAQPNSAPASPPPPPPHSQQPISTSTKNATNITITTTASPPASPASLVDTKVFPEGGTTTHKMPAAAVAMDPLSVVVGEYEHHSNHHHEDDDNTPKSGLPQMSMDAVMVGGGGEAFSSNGDDDIPNMKELSSVTSSAFSSSSSDNDDNSCGSSSSSSSDGYHRASSYAAPIRHRSKKIIKEPRGGGQMRHETAIFDPLSAEDSAIIIPNAHQHHAAHHNHNHEGAVGDSSRGGSSRNSMLPTFQVMITDSMDIDDLMGSNSLSDASDFIQHLAVEKERDEDGNRVLNGYVFIGNLGAGAYGKVRLAYERGNQHKKYAVKIMPRSISRPVGQHHKPDHFKKEVAIMKALRHKNIVSLHAVVDDPDAKKIYMVMDYIEGGNLLDEETSPSKLSEGYIYKPLPESQAVKYTGQLVDGLRYLHKHCIAHRDIKPTNILRSKVDDRVFITDFGVSELGSYLTSVQDLNSNFSAAVEKSVLSDESPPGSPIATMMMMKEARKSTTASFSDFNTYRDHHRHSSSYGHNDNNNEDPKERCAMIVYGQKGTPMFWSPEMFRATTHEYFVDGEAQDTWALGVTLFMMLTGKSPFKSTQFYDLKQEIGGPDAVIIPDTLSINAQSLLRAMLCKDAHQRLTLLQVRRSDFFLDDRRSRSPLSNSSSLLSGGGTKTVVQNQHFLRAHHETALATTQGASKYPPSLLDGRENVSLSPFAQYRLRCYLRQVRKNLLSKHQQQQQASKLQLNNQDSPNTSNTVNVIPERVTRTTSTSTSSHQHPKPPQLVPISEDGGYSTNGATPTSTTATATPISCSSSGSLKQQQSPTAALCGNISRSIRSNGSNPRLLSSQQQQQPQVSGSDTLLLTQQRHSLPIAPPPALNSKRAHSHLPPLPTPSSSATIPTRGGVYSNITIPSQTSVTPTNTSTTTRKQLIGPHPFSS